MVRMEWHEPQLAGGMTLADLEAIESDTRYDRRYAVAEKHDGFRAMVYVDEHGDVTLLNRGGSDYTKHFPHLTEKNLPDLADSVIDGEVVGPYGNVGSTQSVFGGYPETGIAYQDEHGPALFHAFGYPEVPRRGHARQDSR